MTQLPPVSTRRRHHLRRGPARGPAIACLILGLAASPATASAREAITIHGSDTMLILNQEWAAEYAKRNPTIQITVLGGGSGRGIEALMTGRADIAAASRAMKESEQKTFEEKIGARPIEVIVALDGIGVYVHNNNPVGSLTLDQLARILSGEIRNWREVGGGHRRIDIYNRDIYSGTRAFMQQHVLRDKPFSNLAREVSTTAVLTACVSRNQSAIGYGGIAYAQGAHIIRLANRPGEVPVWPSHENVSAGKYPLSRPLHFYVNPASMDETTRAFVDWVRSPEGQRIVTFVGYYPAPGAAAEPASPEADPAPVISREAIRITPDNMLRHGFDLTITLGEGGDGASSGQTSVTLRFDPAGHSIHRIRTVSVHIGEDVEIPLTLGRDLAATFVLRKALLATTSVHLAEAGAPEDGAIYLVSLSAFCSAD